MSNPEYSIVVVHAAFLKPGDPINEDWFTLYALPYEETTEAGPPPSSTGMLPEPDRMTKENVGFSFTFAGLWHSSYSSGPEEELAENKDGFRDGFLPQILEAARKLIDHQIRQWKEYKTGFKPNDVSFFTLWEYESYRSYEGEYDSCINYLGVFPAASLRKLVPEITL